MARRGTTGKRWVAGVVGSGVSLSLLLLLGRSTPLPRLAPRPAPLPATNAPGKRAPPAPVHAAPQAVPDDSANAPLELDPGGPMVTGKILDGLGGSIVGAVVSSSVDPSGPVLATVLSGPEGVFGLSARSPSVELCAQADGYSLACSRALVPSDGNELVLLPASSIQGHVLSAGSGEGIARATVTAINRDARRAQTQTTVTGEDGAFTFGAIAAGSYELVAVSEAARGLTQRVIVGVGEDLENVQLIAERAVTLAGEVLVMDAPCRSGRVDLYGPVRVGAPVSAEGELLLQGLLPGRYTAVISCSAAISERTTIEVATETVRQVWSLRPLPSSSQQHGGEPPTATLIASIRGAAGHDNSAEVIAESNTGFSERARHKAGHFVFDELPLGSYRVYPDDELEQAQQVELTRAGESVTVQLSLAARTTLSGLVVDLDDLPVADAWVRAYRADLASTSLAAPVLTDMNGRFALRAVQGALYTLQVSSPAGDALLREVRASKETVVRVLRPASLSGVVRSAALENVPDFHVEVTREQDPEQYDVQGTDSHFSLPELRPGTYRVDIRCVSGTASRKIVAGPGAALRVEMTLQSSSSP